MLREIVFPDIDRSTPRRVRAGRIRAEKTSEGRGEWVDRDRPQDDQEMPLAAIGHPGGAISSLPELTATVGIGGGVFGSEVGALHPVTRVRSN